MLTPETFPDAHLRAIAEAASAMADRARLPYSLDNDAALSVLGGELRRAHALLIAHAPKQPAPANPLPWPQVLQVQLDATRAQIREAYWALTNASTSPVRLAELDHAFAEGLAATDDEPQPEVAQGLPV